MARTSSLKTIQARIAALQQQADAIQKQEERGGVIERIRVAIEHYDLTSAELFDGKKATPPKRKGAGQVKYKDDAGNTWTGFGPKPKWFTSALEAGKTVEELGA